MANHWKRWDAKLQGLRREIYVMSAWLLIIRANCGKRQDAKPGG